jgi:hypothetical protein
MPALRQMIVITNGKVIGIGIISATRRHFHSQQNWWSALDSRALFFLGILLERILL